MTPETSPTKRSQVFYLFLSQKKPALPREEAAPGSEQGHKRCWRGNPQSSQPLPKEGFPISPSSATAMCQNGPVGNLFLHHQNQCLLHACSLMFQKIWQSLHQIQNALNESFLFPSVSYCLGFPEEGG